jgi:DNA repair exonuclease SbcCD ATPase subunit
VVLRLVHSKRETLTKVKQNLESDLDALFQLPLAEFTAARNALAARLKQSGRANDATIVKALVKPSISAWAVNQLYWQHRDVFNDLLAAGNRVQRLQTSGLAAMRASLDARREALSHLSDLATSLLREAGHNPALETIRRVTTTLEALSSYASVEDGPTPGRLTQDVDPPGFETLASMVPIGRSSKAGQGITRSPASEKPANAKAQSSAQKNRQLEEARKTKIAVTKISLQTAKKSLAEARSELQRLESAQKKTSAEANEAEKERREAERQLKHARLISEEATRRARSIAEEARAAAKSVEDANRSVAKLSKELESLFRNHQSS